jgi:hypothetical protein
LQAFVRTNASADARQVRLFAGDFEPLAEYQASRKGSQHRRFGGMRPEQPS